MPVNFSPQGLPPHCQITYTITCPSTGGGATKGGGLGIYAPFTPSSIDAASTTTLPDTNDEPDDDEDDEDYYEDETEEDEDLEYDDDVDEDELDDLDESYEDVTDEDDDEYEYEDEDEEDEKASGVKGCQECNVRVYKYGVQGGYDPDNLRFRDINGKFLRDP